MLATRGWMDISVSGFASALMEDPLLRGYGNFAISFDKVHRSLIHFFPLLRVLVSKM